MSKNIFITRKIPGPGIKMLEEKGYTVDFNPKTYPPSQRQIIRALRRKPYDAVITLLTDKIDARVFDSAPTVKIYANFAVGYDNYDVLEAKKRGIVVTNTPGDYTTCVVEHAFALMLGLTTRMVEGDDFIRRGKFQGWSPTHFIGTDLKGKKLGLIGAGRIGELVARSATRGFDMSVIYHDISRNEKIEKEYGAVFAPTVEEVLAQADIVSLHVPLLDSTRHLINEARLKMMKPTSFLINTSRGPVVDEVALVRALQTGVIRGAGLDVFEFEPRLVRGLTKLPNVILTPHIGSARESARNEMSTVAAENIIDFFEGRSPRNAVNT